ncbi:YpsA SLOG family protein [Thermodesulfobacteriota bacterium]
MLTKIISGGQIGAEQAALDVAIKLGFPHGGWIQKGRKTESWTLAEKYKLKELSTSSFKGRIEKNVTHSDGTLILSHGRLTGGADYSRKMAEKHDRPCLHIDLNDTPGNVSAIRINAWTIKNNVEILNVTGPRASEDPEIYIATIEVLERAYNLSENKDTPRALDPAYIESLLEQKPASNDSPKTVEEAIGRLISELSLKDRTAMANMAAEEVALLNYTIGNYIRSAFGLAKGNEALMISCRLVSKMDVHDENHASMIIVNELWKKLQATHKLRVVK